MLHEALFGSALLATETLDTAQSLLPTPHVLCDVQIGRLRVATPDLLNVVRPGEHLTVVAWGWVLHETLAAAEALAAEDISIEVIDPRSLNPLDTDTLLESIRRTGRLAVVHEDTRTGGIAGEIAAVVNEEAFEHLDGPIVRLTSLDTPVPFSPPLEEYFLPQVSDVIREARKLLAY